MTVNADLSGRKAGYVSMVKSSHRRHLALLNRWVKNLKIPMDLPLDGYGPRYPPLNQCTLTYVHFWWSGFARYDRMKPTDVLKDS